MDDFTTLMQRKQLLTSFVDGSKYGRMQMDAIIAAAILNEIPKFKKLFLDDGLLIHTLNTSGDLFSVKLLLAYNPVSKCLDGYLDSAIFTYEDSRDPIEDITHLSIEHAESQRGEDSKVILKLYREKDSENLVVFEGELDKFDLMS